MDGVDYVSLFFSDGLKTLKGEESLNMRIRIELNANVLFFFLLQLNANVLSRYLVFLLINSF